MEYKNLSELSQQEKIEYLKWAFDPQLKSHEKNYQNSELPCLLYAMVELPAELTLWNATSNNLEDFYNRLQDAFGEGFQWEAPFLHKSKFPRFTAARMTNDDNQS